MTPPTLVSASAHVPPELARLEVQRATWVRRSSVGFRALVALGTGGVLAAGFLGKMITSTGPLWSWLVATMLLGPPCALILLLQYWTLGLIMRARLRDTDARIADLRGRLGLGPGAPSTSSWTR